jgi:hypothetical protein
MATKDGIKIDDSYLSDCVIQGLTDGNSSLIEGLTHSLIKGAPHGLPPKGNVKGNVEQSVKSVIQNLFTKKDGESHWKKCEGKCYELLEKLVKAEIDSTAYMLRILCKAQINVGGSKAVNTVSFQKISEKDQKLTGVWDEDKGQLELIWKEKEIIGGGVEDSKGNVGDVQEEDSHAHNGILVFGLGPSGAGKTYWGGQLIGLLNESGLLPGGGVDPKCFLSIDGGKYRKESFVYEAIVKVAQKYGGLLNLATKTLFNMDGRIIFDSDYIKDRLLAWLCIQNARPNLYVPETLSSCDLGVFVRSLHRVLGINNCKSKIQKYIDITGDNNPIILHIWQHWDGEQCPFRTEYKCKGCKQSGHEREKKEGKKYPTYPLSYYTAEHSAKIEELLALDTKQPRILLSLHSSEQHDGVGGNNLLVNHSTYDDGHPYVEGFKLFKKKVKALEYNSKPILISLVNDDHIPPEYYETHLKPESSFFTKCLTVAAMLILFL